MLLSSVITAVCMFIVEYIWGFPGGSDVEESAAMQETWI